MSNHLSLLLLIKQSITDGAPCILSENRTNRKHRLLYTIPHQCCSQTSLYVCYMYATCMIHVLVSMCVCKFVYIANLQTYILTHSHVACIYTYLLYTCSLLTPKYLARGRREEREGGRKGQKNAGREEGREGTYSLLAKDRYMAFALYISKCNKVH